MGVQPDSVVSVSRMQAIDTQAIHSFGIPRLLLMEHAGLALAQGAASLLQDTQRPITVCCGTGYNGGDGLCAVRHLHAWGYNLRVILTGQVDRLREEPAVYAGIVAQLGVPLIEITTSTLPEAIQSWLSESALVMDALLGIGVSGAVREPMASLIQAMNRANKPVVSADIPSGLDADTGKVQGQAIQATLTVTFGLAKQGCFKEAGPAQTGKLQVASITIPQRLLTAEGEA